MKPILKWAGEKRKLYLQIKEQLPKEFNKYLEPFFGGGAILFGLKNDGLISKAYVNDINKELMNVYNVVSREPCLLMEKMDELTEKHLQKGEPYYYHVRSLDRLSNYEEKDNIFKAARMVYLNKSCYNGLYRVNATGYFNVPFGHKKNVKLYERENLMKVSSYLSSKEVKLFNLDYNEFVRKNVKKGDFVYLDPPYDIAETHNTFAQYQKNGFGKESQKDLYELCCFIDDVGAYFVQSNSGTEFILDLYKERFNLNTINVKRVIGAKGESRGDFKEVLITNY